MAELKATGDELLVAIDFSPCSLRALDAALEWRRDNTELTLLYVLDRAMVDQIAWIGLGSADEVLARMRTRAENELARLVSERGASRLETMVVVGEPFVEIVKIANDLECDVIFIGIHGREAGLKQLLFGGTAEKVLRGANRPVLCVP
jgi:universal stress protein A